MVVETLSSNQQGTVFHTGSLVNPDGSPTEEREWVDGDEYRRLRRLYDDGVTRQQDLNGAHERDVEQLEVEIQRLNAALIALRDCGNPSCDPCGDCVRAASAVTPAEQPVETSAGREGNK